MRDEETVVRRQVVVNAPPPQAFAIFVERLGDFKPKEHNLLPVPIETSIFEPRVGGSVYDRGVDGSVCRWGRVLVYEPPDRIVFTWDISPQWTLVEEKERTSEVEVRFVAEGSGQTRVELEHRKLDRHGPGWEAVEQGVAHDQGWTLYLTRYAALADH